jgi:hypothetical protein
MPGSNCNTTTATYTACNSASYGLPTCLSTNLNKGKFDPADVTAITSVTSLRNFL